MGIREILRQGIKAYVIVFSNIVKKKDKNFVSLRFTVQGSILDSIKVTKYSKGDSMHSDSIKESLVSKGYTFLGIVDGELIYCNLSSEESIKNMLEFLGKLTGEEWDTYVESCGLCNRVFYRRSMYSIDTSIRSYLHFNENTKWAELPLNCSSCYRMFSKCRIGGDALVFDERFNTSNVADMTMMFNNCLFSDNTSLGDHFITHNVRRANEMFYNCKFGDNCSLGDNFEITDENCVDLFYQCDPPVSFDFGKSFHIKSKEQLMLMLYGMVLPLDNSASGTPYTDWIKKHSKTLECENISAL